MSDGNVEKDTGKRREGDKGTKEINERREGGKVMDGEINHSQLNFNGPLRLVILTRTLESRV
jgi:hypothetical protein